MTTTTDNSTPTREGVYEYDWESDTLGETRIAREMQGGKEVTTYYYLIHDFAFDDAWLQSSVSQDLAKKA